MSGRPVWDVEAYIHAKHPSEHAGVLCAETKLRFIVESDSTWTVIVTRDDATFDLMLRGGPQSRTSATLCEVFGWIFGIAA